MTKQEIFRESTTNLKRKTAVLYEREPERKLYDEGKIGWNEYLKLAKKREEEQREFYKGNENFELYDAGLITYDEFLKLEGK
ncbi:MAG: hypothetical protein KHZ87_03905 [Clostridiales bacterium]|nr:hypothetical protein [Clostridiales bacterium]MBS5877777.1 hypothetical protein [Clostridiales bacterium]